MKLTEGEKKLYEEEEKIYLQLQNYSRNCWNKLIQINKYLLLPWNGVISLLCNSTTTTRESVDLDHARWRGVKECYPMNQAHLHTFCWFVDELPESESHIIAKLSKRRI